jgi:hypothetical protein
MRGAAAFLAPLAAFVVLAACASKPTEDPIRVEAGTLDETTYGTLVHPVMERACGTADCHGMLPRGLRVYGATGLRLENATGATTPDEIRATYISIVGLEPENLKEFTAARTQDKAYKLLVLAKPLTFERHRGGVSLRKGEPAEQCILSWLMGVTDQAACTR